MGRIWGGDPIPRPRPIIPAPSPIPAPPRLGGTFFPPSRPHRVPTGTRPAPL